MSPLKIQHHHLRCKPLNNYFTTKAVFATEPEKAQTLFWAVQKMIAHCVI
jgi:hypothetical protein